MKRNYSIYIKKFVFSLTISLLAILIAPTSGSHTVQAACNFHSSMTVNVKNVIWNSVCTIASLEGVDNALLSETSTSNSASIVLGTNGSVTINATGKLFTGTLGFTGGNIAIQSGGAIKLGSPVYLYDRDGDGWPASFAFLEASVSGARRLSLMKSYSTIDCNDTNDYRENNVCCTPTTWYRDADADGYGTATSTTSSCGQPAGYVSNTSDCYDGNINAKPGSTYCGSTNRGDGSFDYNCSASSTKCGTIYNYSTGLTTWYGSHGTGSCNRNNAACRSNNINYYPGATYSCGQTGAICSLQTWHEEGCGDCGESPDSQYRCTAIVTGIQSCQ